MQAHSPADWRALPQTRYCVRWRSDLGLLVLKVTNDRKVSFLLRLPVFNRSISSLSPLPHGQCLKFKTRSSAFLNRFELLNRSMLAKCQNRHRVEAVNPAFIVVNAEPMAAAASAAIASGGEGSPLASGGAKEEGKSKKKKGKKKK